MTEKTKALILIVALTLMLGIPVIGALIAVIQAAR